MKIDLFIYLGGKGLNYFLKNVQELTEATWFCRSSLPPRISPFLNITLWKYILIYFSNSSLLCVFLKIPAAAVLRLLRCGRSCGCGCGQNFQPQIVLRYIHSFKPHSNDFIWNWLLVKIGDFWKIAHQKN